jgi:ABC-2 type transport system ATP-binding protein
VLLLDEPTFGVDPVSRRDLWRIVHEMVGRGVTAVVATAYLDEAERFDRLALLHRGRLLVVDSPRALQAAFEGELLEARVDGARHARGIAERVAGVRGAQLFGDTLHVTVDEAATAGAALAAALLAAGHPVHQMARIPPSLEDVFLARIAGAGEAA